MGDIFFFSAPNRNMTSTEVDSTGAAAGVFR
jgi:hypothetical protein